MTVATTFAWRSGTPVTHHRLFALWLAAALLGPASAADSTRPPATDRIEVKDVLHGVEIVDPYRWLEDQDSPATRAWLEKQIAFTESQLHAVPGRDAIKHRLTELLKIDSVGIPTHRGGRYFFSRRKADQDLPVIVMRTGLEGKDEVLLDPNAMSADKMTSVSLLDLSVDGKLLAYGVRKGGEDEVEIRVMDIDQRKDLPDRLPRGRYAGVSLTPDHKGFFYSQYGSQQGPRARFHAFGTEPGKDEEFFGKGYGQGAILSLDLSDNGKHLLLTVYYGSAPKKTEVYYRDVAARGPVIPLVNDVEARFTPSFVGEKVLLKTNWNAPNERVLLVDLARPGREHWKEVLPEQNAVLSSVRPAGGKLIAEYLRHARSELAVYHLDGKKARDVELPTLGSVGGISGEWDRSEVFYGFSSFHWPTSIVRLDLETGTSTDWARLQVPINPEKFEVKQVWYASKDGTKIPMFLIHAKGLPLDGNRPTLLTGYGGFNISRTPAFSAVAALWIEYGGVYALPNLRGGGEFGEAWHQAGMLDKKQNVFDDFIAAAEWLIEHKYTNSQRLAISGGSNGGLLVGAAMTQRPELFRAVVCSVPLLDMIRYHQFLVARFWVPEYGSSENPEQFKYLLKYSPYHNVKKGVNYPATLFVTGDSDTRVAPLHARKMAALLQWATGSDRPILLHYDTKAGHSAGLPIHKVISDTTDTLAFLFWQLAIQAVPEAAGFGS